MMKLLVTITSALVALILCAHETASGSVSIYGDIIIESSDKNGNFNCDGFICPENTSSCEVTKRNDPNDFEQVLRLRKCQSDNGTLLKQDLVREPNRYHDIVNVNVRNGGGRKLTPEEERQLREHLDGVQRQVASQLEENMSKLNEALRPLQDGSFAADLQNRFGGGWQNGAFNGAARPYPYESRRPAQAGTYASNVKRHFGSDSESSGFNDDSGPYSDENIRRAQSRPYYANTGGNFAPFLGSDFHDEMRPFVDGSFAANLRNEINNNVRESLRDVLP